MKILQKWSGFVDGIDGSSFSARITDLSKSNPEELAVFPIKSIPTKDLQLLKVGVYFTWIIGIKTGCEETTSEFTLNRSTWTEQDFVKARQEAKRIADSLVWD